MTSVNSLSSSSTIMWMATEATPAKIMAKKATALKASAEKRKQRSDAHE